MWAVEILGGDSDVPLNDKVEESREKSSSYPESDGKINTESDEQFDADNNDDDEDDDDEYTEEDGESDAENNVDDDRSYTEEDGDSDVSALRRLIKIERRRGNAACTELEKERAASATAAEEAMAMILRLQNEKSLIEMEFIQYRRLAEEKQIHDQEVIQSLQWIVWRHESERSLLQEELKFCRRKLNRLLKSDEREVEESPSPLSGYAEDVLESLLYSSLDFNLTPK
ncbi:hypothetical protein Pfo_004885 [Paulownia fortunei]|nr:hypothetical protein Pfo_004885 [Paulownia fortunei]